MDSPNSREMTHTSTDTNNSSNVNETEEETILLINGKPYIIEKTPNAPNQNPNIIREVDPTKEEDHHLSANSGTFGGSVVTIMTCAIGSGVISLPYAFSGAGIFVSLGLMLFMSTITLYSLHLLVKSATWSHAPTYQRLANIAFGTAGTAVVQVLIAIGLFGSMVGFIIIIGDISPPVICAIAGKKDKEECGDLGFWYNRDVLSACFLVAIMTPLSFFPKIHQFQISSFIAVVTVCEVMLAIIIRSIQALVTDTYHHPILYTRWSFWGITRALPIMAFSLGCHVQIIPIYYALKTRDALGSSTPLTNWRRMDAVVATSNTLTTLTYVLVGEFGLLDFGVDVEPNILDSYSFTDYLITASRLCMAVHISLAFPLLVWPFRTVMDGWLRSFPIRSVAHFSKNHPILVFIAQTLGVIALAYGGAVLVPHIGIVFAYIGSIVSTLLNFVLPGAFYIQLSKTTEAEKKVKWFKKLPAALLIIVGIAIGITGTSSTTYKLITNGK